MAITNGTNTTAHLRDLWETDISVVRSLERQLGFKFDVDLAGTPFNRKAPWVITNDPRFRFDWQIPGLRCSWDAFKTDWSKLGRYGFLNCPFSLKHKFTPLCEHYSRKGMTIVSVLPVAIATGWWQKMERSAERILVPDKRINYIHPMTGVMMNGVNFETAFAIWQPRKHVIIERISI